MNYLENLKKMKEKYGDPFKERAFPKETSIRGVLDNFSENKKMTLAGRVISKREHGKSSFAHISDITGKIQIYAQLNILKEKYELFKDLDIGDIVGVKGYLFKTKTGEPTVFVEDLRLLSKCLRILPEKWHGLKDIEVKYRQRYLDLIASPDTRQVFLKRIEIIELIRDFFKKLEYKEVETPLLHLIPGGARGTPFATYYQAIDTQVYLRIAPELYLKRLLVAGFDKIFEINRSFRNEGISLRHSPEFTMLEAYCAYQDYEYMIKICEDLFSSLVEKIHKSLRIEYQGKEIDFTPPWPRISFVEVFEKELGVSPSDSPEVVRKKLSERLNISLKELSRSQIMNLVEELIEKKLEKRKPVFVVDFFSWMSPLAKTKKDNPYVAERFELFIGGIEVANSYTELNDPIKQRENFELQIKNGDTKRIDEEFLLSLEYGMPPAAGLGVGIDRLIMLLLNQASIRDVILFPLLRPFLNK